MSDLTTIARPYAQAAFDFALEKQQIVNWGEMLSFAAAVAKDPQVTNLLTNSFSVLKLAEIFLSICDDRLDSHGQNFIKLMAENRRLSLLPYVAQLFFDLKQDYEKEIDAKIVSAIELSQKQQDALSLKLEHRFASKIKLHCTVDPSLLGGVIIQVGDVVIDNSTRNNLKRLSYELQF